MIAELIKIIVSVATQKEAVPSPNPHHPGLPASASIPFYGLVRPIKCLADDTTAFTVRIRICREQLALLEEENAEDTNKRKGNVTTT